MSPKESVHQKERTARKRLVIPAVLILLVVVAAWRLLITEKRPTIELEGLFDWETINDTQTLDIGLLTQEIYVNGGVLMNISVYRFTSQSWKGGSWTHIATIFQPLGYTGEHAAVVCGGFGEDPVVFLDQFGMFAAVESGIPVMVVSGVPNTHQFGIEDEGELMAHSVSEFLEPGDPSWPLIYPMAVAYMRAETLMHSVLNNHPSKFLITGGGKRGWACWIAAAADPRVVAMAPRSFNAADVGELMSAHLETYGKLEGDLKDFEPLAEELGSPEWEEFEELYNPVTHFDRLRAQVLVLVGTDDALNPLGMEQTYSEAIGGEFFIGYVANANHTALHNTEEAAAAWRILVNHVANGYPIPEVGSLHADISSGKGTFRVSTDPHGAEISFVHLWYAFSDTSNFLSSNWSVETMDPSDGRYEVEIAVPQGTNVASFVAVYFEVWGRAGYVTSGAIISKG